MEAGMDIGMTKTRDNIMQAPLMDRAYIDEHDVVQRYIRHTLDEVELARFEIYMLSNPSIVDEIEQQKVLNQIFREELPKAGAVPASNNVLHRFRHAIPLAACLVLALYVGLNTVDRAPASAGQSSQILDTVVLQDMRGAASAFNVTLPAQVAGSARVELPLKVDVGPQLEPVVTYNIFVRSGDGKTLVAQQENQHASADGWLELTIAVPGTVPASYQVEVVEFPRGDSRRYSLSLQ